MQPNQLCNVDFEPTVEHRDMLFRRQCHKQFLKRGLTCGVLHIKFKFDLKFEVVLNVPIQYWLGSHLRFKRGSCNFLAWHSACRQSAMTD